MLKHRAKIFIGLICSILTIFFIVYLVDLQEVLENLQKLSWYIIAAVLALYLINMLLRSVRWRIIMTKECSIKLNLVFRAMVYGYMLNQLLPLKMGEIGQAEYLTRKSKANRSFLLGTIAVKRIFDMLVISMFLGYSILFSETVMNNLKSNIIPVLLLLTGFIAAVFLLFNFSGFKKFTKYMPSKTEQFFNHVVDNVTQSFSMFKFLREVILVLLFSFVIWGLTSLTFYLILADLDISLPFYAYFFIVSAGTFGMIIPSTSANIGVYHAVAMGALMLFMVPKAQALTFAIVAHAFDFFPSVVLGGIIFGLGRLKELIRN